MGTADNVVGDDGGYGVAIFAYRAITADNTLADMQTDEFVEDAEDLGVRIGDIIIFVEETVDASWALVVSFTNLGADTIIVSNP